MAAVEASFAVSARGSDMNDPALLFERYSTEDIRLVERRVRGDIEHKKEELRQMVGERYRDLIDAADTIRDMRQSSESVFRAVTAVGLYCSGLKPGNARPDSTQRGDQTWQQQFFSTAAQIALLLDIPERVWSALEAGQYLRATQLYLLSLHLHKQLQLQPSPRACYSPVLARFPILVRQVATTGQFRSSILLDSRSVLRGHAVSDQAIAEALVSSMLLEGSSPRQALSHFLLARKASIQQLLTQPQHGAGIKAQVCSLVELLVTTLFQAYAVFYLPPEGSPKPLNGALSCGLLFSTIQCVTTPVPGETRSILHDHSSASGWSNHLPPSTLQFQPTLKTLAQPIQSTHLRHALQQWIHTCQDDMAVGVAALLMYVKSLKGLSSIRDAVLELLSTDALSQHWDTVCASLLERPLLVWDHFLEELFLHRLQAITKEGTESISSSCVQLLSSALSDLEGSSEALGFQLEADVASFLWSESAGDLLSDAGWVSVSQREQQQHSGLAMKTQALTPCVQSLCSSLDTQLKARLDDLQHYLLPQDSEPTSGVAGIQRKDCPAEEALREGSVSCVRHILQYIHTRLLPFSNQARLEQLTPVLFMARLCQSMAQLSPSLKQCILGKQTETQPTPKGTPRQSKVPRGRPAETSPTQAQWALIKEELLNCSMDVYRIWSSALSKVLLDRFGTAVLSQSSGTVLSCGACWEDLEIQEENESGSSITSTISLPAQPSWFVQALLFRLCVEVNRVGGHAVPRATLQELLHMCLSQALHYYTRLTQTTQQDDSIYPMTQNRALQLLFDLRYLSSTLGGKVEEGRSPQSKHEPRMQEACDWLESFIDPFDLDVFTPHMNANLGHLSQRTSVLLGILTGPEKQYTSRNSVHTQEASNILPLTCTTVRFGLLPLSSSSARKSKTMCRRMDTGHPLGPGSSEQRAPDPYFHSIPQRISWIHKLSSTR
ncbi:conserved oligomeric Golgi complex subunit 1 [Eucyclogobius newberryi]|uniref:conserved oligomeric Golgi complex subunit 1 n=1 Tax=Eucyclogobius newberryi TaxID=166745 RepID=UPI003B5A04CD